MLWVKVAAVALMAAVAGAHPAPKQYYLALGDSITYGVHPERSVYRPRGSGPVTSTCWRSSCAGSARA